LYILLTICVFFCSQEAKAGPCSEVLSLEDAFIKADMVFLGVAGDRQGSGRAFHTKELYKMPIGISDPKTVIVPESIEERFQAGADYFVFGRFDKGNGATTLRASSCAGTRPTPHTIINHIRAVSDDPPNLDEATGKRDTLIFTGRVVATRHGEKKRTPSDAVERAPYTVSEIDFEVLETLKNTTNNPVLTDPKVISISARSCGEQFKVGQTYVVFAHSEMVLSPTSENKRARKKIFETYCRPSSPINLNTKQILQRLSLFHTSQENLNVDRYNE
jgi:hypothetical protein